MIILIAHNIRSTYNVGAILRTADGFGVQKVYFTGYTPYPALPGDARLPHIRDKITKQIHKTALGAEKTVDCTHIEDPLQLIIALKAEGLQIAALEQSAQSVKLNAYRPARNIALLLGEEVAGVSPELLKLCDVTLEIPMQGSKESFNVSVATGIALYALTFQK